MENSVDLILLEWRTTGSHLDNAEGTAGIQNTLGYSDALQRSEALLYSDNLAEEWGSHSQKALLPLLAEEQQEQNLELVCGLGQD